MFIKTPIKYFYLFVFILIAFTLQYSLRWNTSWTSQSPLNKENNDWRHVNILRERHESCFVKVNRFVDRKRADNGGPPYGRVASRWAAICMRPADISTPARSFVCLVLSSSRYRFLKATIDHGARPRRFRQKRK